MTADQADVPADAAGGADLGEGTAPVEPPTWPTLAKPGTGEGESLVEGRRFDDLDLPEQSWRGFLFESCTFVRCTFDGASFADCEFVECAFEDCSLSGVAMSGVRLSGSRFAGCKLVGLDWTGVDWPTVRFYDPVRFERSNLYGAFFAELPLPGVSFVECQLAEADFCDCDLTGVDFEASTLEHARFERANLADASFIGTSGLQVDLRTAQIDGTRFDLAAAISLLEVLPLIIER